MLVRLGKSRSGSMALWGAGLLIVAILVIGGVIDYASLMMQKRDVQNAADAAALSAARELLLGVDAEKRVQDVAQSFVAANYPRPSSTHAVLIEKGAAVRVTVTSPPRVYFTGPVARNAGPVKAVAIAEVVGRDIANACVIALDPGANRALSLDSNASLVAPKCAVYSNSTDKKGLSSLSNARIKAQLICTAGGKEGSTSNFSPQPVTDCPAFSDPLAARAPPPVGGCNFNKFEKKDYTGKIQPGVYCGGLRIDGNSKVTLEPGVYVIKNGQFRVDSNSQVEGEHVGFYFTGASTHFEFTSNAVIRLSAPKDGPMAGLLFFEDRTLPNNTMHKITSNYADYLVGTVYLPRGILRIDANNDVAEASEFTVLVVRQLELRAGPRLYLNTDYGLSDVPVPEGVGNKVRPTGVRLSN